MNVSWYSVKPKAWARPICTLNLAWNWIRKRR